MVIKEWRCSCGDFESDMQICPKCGSVEVQRVFLSPIAIKGDMTKFKDRSLSDFTNYYGLSDYSNNQSTKHEKDFSDLWKPTTDLVSDPSLAAGGESALIQTVAKEAAQKVHNPTFVGRDK